MKNNKYWIIPIVGLLLLGLFFFMSQSKNSSEPPLDQITGHIIQNTGADNSDPGNNIEVLNNASGSNDNFVEEVVYEEQPNPQPAIVEPVIPSEETSCGNTNCPTDAICVDGSCRVVECKTDSDCVDTDPCTVDVCRFAGHLNAFCAIDIITRDSNGDGCCPVNSYIDRDTDCAPVCGNHKCEVGETTATCYDDCRHAGSDNTDSAPPEEPSPPPS